MIQAMSRPLKTNQKLLSTIYVLIGLAWLAMIIKGVVQIFEGNLSPSLLEITKDAFFIVLFSLSLVFIYTQLNTYYTGREKVYAKLFQKNPHPMWVYDLKTLQFLMVNDAAISLYGYGKHEFLNMTIKDIRPAEDVPALINEAEKIKLNFNLDYHWSGTWRHKKKNEQLMYVEISSHEIIFEGKKAELVMAYDVTEKINQDLKLQTLNRDLERNVIKRTDDLLQLNRKLVDQNRLIKSTNLELYAMTSELQQANEKIRESTDTKNKFISMVSHEFRMPLTNIKSATSFVKGNISKTSQQEIIKRIEGIERHATNMVFLLDDVLTIGNADSLKIAVKMAPVNIRDFVNKITQEVLCTMGAMSRCTHRILLSVNENVPEFILSDEKLLRSIFINLLTNAIKYSPNKDSVCFDINSVGKNVACRVIDGGIGINTEELKRVFEPFYRMDSTKDLPGTGLGLTIVKKAVDLINAKISIESEPDKGSVFSVLLQA